MDGQGNISLPSDIGATAMTVREICELFGVIAPTVRAGIKALCKSGVLSIYDIKRIIRISDRYSAEVYNLETIAALAFRIESFGAAKSRPRWGVQRGLASCLIGEFSAIRSIAARKIP